MTTTTQVIADKVRGVAAERRVTQQDIATALGISRTSVAERFAARVPYTAPEIFTLSILLHVPVNRFYPDPQSTPVPEATPPAVSVTGVSSSPVLDAIPDPGVEGGGTSASGSAAA